MEKSFTLTRVQLSFVVFCSLIAGVVMAFVVLMEPFSGAKKIKDGGITFNAAFEHSSGHTSGINGWRGKTNGIWYGIDTIRRYLNNLDTIMNDADHVPLPGYKWKIGIYYGKGDKGKKGRLMTMFIPTLVDSIKNMVIDPFFAKKCYDTKKLNDTRLPWNDQILYKDIYARYYLIYAEKHKKATGEEDAIVFDSGNMFP